MSMTSNTAPTTAGVRLVSEPNNFNLFRYFTEQANAYTHGTLAWYFNNGDWQSNKGFPSSRDLNRFEIHFNEPKTVCGFSVGGLSWFETSYCYANCLLIEGRQSNDDFWQPLGEVEFAPAERRTRYFDFPINRTVSQLRVTVQDVTRGQNPSNSTSVYLPPMQVYGLAVEATFPPYGINVDAPMVPAMGQLAAGNVVIIERDGRLFAVPTA